MASKNHQLEQLLLSVASLRSGKYSDFTIRCADNTLIPVHRAIVCQRSQVFSAAIDGVFKEALSREIFLEEDEPLIVAKMIDFLYCLDYNDHQKDETKESALILNAKVYIMADKYDIQPLKSWAVTKYQEVLRTMWNSNSFTESARLIFDNSPESDMMLREVIIQSAIDHAKALFDRGEFVELLRSDGDFATKVLRGVLFKKVEEVAPDNEWGGLMPKNKKKLRIFD